MPISPRFVGIYAKAKVPASWRRIEDEQGGTFRTSLEQALTTTWPRIQIATWNHWVDATMIEPNREFGCRDLELLQEMRRKQIDSELSATASDLPLPRQLLWLRRITSGPKDAEQLDRIARVMAAGRLAQARSGLKI